MKIRANGLTIEVEDSGQSDQPVLLLIMGLGLQLTSWAPRFLRTLIAGGYRVVRFDNRDSGLSDHFDHMGKPNLPWFMLRHRLGLSALPHYSLQDMCGDALGVLDALDIKQAHVAGVSMGGMIAQRLALTAPQRVVSLTNIMSSSGARKLPLPRADICRILWKGLASEHPEAVIENTVRMIQMVSGGEHPQSERRLRASMNREIKRAFRPAGVSRQLMAIMADADRAELLKKITIPTLILHGKADPLLWYVCGVDLAQRIPGAKLVGFDGMGHELPARLIRPVCAAMTDHFKFAASLRSGQMA